MQWSRVLEMLSACACFHPVVYPYYVVNRAEMAEQPVNHGDMTVITPRHIRAIADSRRPKVLDDCSAAEIQRIADQVFNR